MGPAPPALGVKVKVASARSRVALSHHMVTSFSTPGCRISALAFGTKRKKELREHVYDPKDAFVLFRQERD